MNVKKILVGQGLQRVFANSPVSSCYMLDRQGKEVQITTAMIRSVCQQLLQRCRTPKK